MHVQNRSRQFARILSRQPLVRAVPILVLNCLFLLPAMGQDGSEDAPGSEKCGADEVIRIRGGTVRLENDLFAGTDQNYTNGVAITAVSDDIPGKLQTQCLPAPARLQAQLIKFLNPGFWSDAENPAYTQNVVVKFGQSMYTPEDYSRTDLILDDRPYAGLLYTGMSWNRRKRDPLNNRDMLDTREITVGVIGPLSMAEQSQNAIHDLIGKYRFLGWDNQLHNEPAVQLAFDRKFRNFRGQGAVIPGFSFDSIRTLGFRVGNIETYATAGIEGRFGWNMPNDFGSYPIRPGAENRPPSAGSLHGKSSDSIPAASRPRSGAHFFGTLEAKLVAHDFSLDGNLFRSSHSVTRRPWVVQAAVGFSVQRVWAGHGFRLAVMRVYRSEEFEEQKTDQTYGSIALSMEF